jgi:hypothetical protein
MSERFPVLAFLSLSFVFLMTSVHRAYALQGKVPRVGVVFNGRDFYPVLEFRVGINLKAAKQIGLTIPQRCFRGADNMIN